MTERFSLINPQRLKKLFMRLVDIYSPSGKEEEILHYLNGFLKRRDIPFTRQYVDSHRYNLLLLPQEKDLRLALVGHLDTVAAYDLEEFGYTEQGDRIGGLGTADMKSGCAAMLEAILSLREAGHSTMPVAFCLVVGEEETGDGAEKLAEELTFPWAIIGEPTDLEPALSQYGYLEIQLTAFGQRMHASLDNKGANPIEVMMHLIMRIIRFFKEEHPELVYNIRDLFSSQSGFVVPERCEAWLDIHIPPNMSMDMMLSGLKERIDHEQQENQQVDVHYHVQTLDAGYEIQEEGMILEALKNLYHQRRFPWKPIAFRSHSDANQLRAAGVNPILLGPGKLEMAHSPHESVFFEKVCTAAELYVGLLLNLFT